MLQTPPRNMCNITDIKKDENGVTFFTGNGTVAVLAVAENILRLRYTKQNAFSKQPSYAVVSNQKAAFETEETETEYVIKTAEVTLAVNKQTCRFSYYDKNGSMLVCEPEDGGKHLMPFDVYMPVMEESDVKQVQTPDGVKTVTAGGRTAYAKTAYHARLDFVFSKDEMLYGLGQQEDGILNLRNHTVYLHQANLKNPMPFFLSTNGYGIFVDAYSHMIFHDDEESAYFYCETVDELDYYFIAGETFDRIIGGYRMLTGGTPMLPKWAFGYMQSKEAYETQEEIISVVQEFRKRNIPIDTIIMDWNSWEEGLWGQKSFDRGRFPDPKAMIDTLHDLKVHFMISIWPTMRDGDNLRQMQEHGYMIEGTDLYNAFDEGARALYWKQANEGYFRYGTDAWWCDSSEPICPEWQGGFRLPRAVDYANSVTAYKQLGNDHLSNLYPFMHAKGMYENQRRQTEKKRVVNLTRAVFSGQQRFSTIIWSGDIVASWKTLKKQIAAGLNMCASGIPYWTLDIGAFFVKNGGSWFWCGDFEAGNQGEGYKELYTRWLQYGAFLPVFRSHGTEVPREPWSFGDQGDVYYETIVKFMKLRYRLLPYIYSLAARVTQQHYTMMRLLAFDFKSDKTACGIDDQFMFGDSLMVCPVTEPGAKKRKVYLPKGKIWYDFWTNRVYEGGTYIEYETPIDIIPLFVPGGSIIPMACGEYENTADIPKDDIALYIYPGADASFSLYQDEDDGYRYEQRAYVTQELLWNDREKKLTVQQPKGDVAMIKSGITYRQNIISSR